MASRLPTADDLGPRPTPQSNRALAVVGNAGAVADALAQTGVTVTQVATRIEEVRDEDDVRRLDVEHARRAREIRQRAREARGINAQEARQQAEADLAALDQDVIARARSNTSRRALETMVTRRTTLERDSIIEHARTETNAAMETAITARIDTSLDEAEELWDNPIEMERSLGTALQEIDNRGRWRGADPSTIANERSQARSRVRANVVSQLVQAENYDAANAYLEEHRGEIEAEQEGNLRRLVNSGLRDLEDDRTAAWAIGTDGPDAAPAPVSGTVPADQSPPAAAAETRGASPAPVSTADAREDFKRRVRSSESGGNDRAVNPQPGQTASGRYQFTRETFVTMHRRVYGGNMSDAQRWALRFDAGVQERLMDASIDGYQRTLRAGGQPATPGNLYLSHFFGPETAVRILQNPNASLASLLGSNADQIFRANPNLRRNMTGADAAALTNRAMGGPAPAIEGSPAPDGTNIDLDRAYARIEALDISPSAKLRARNRVRELAAQNDVVRNRARADADEEITRRLAEIAARGERLTNVSQLPANVLSRASPNTVLSVQQMIQANNQPREPEANSPMMASLIIQSARDPNGFLQVNPELLRGRITDAEVISLHRTQAEIRNRDGAQPGTIMSTIGMMLPQSGLIPDEPERMGSGRGRETIAQARARIRGQYEARLFTAVQQRLREQFPAGSHVSQQDVLNAVQAELTPVVLDGRQRRHFEAREERRGDIYVTIPNRALPLIDAQLRRMGLPLSGQERISLYLRNRGYWDAQ